MTECQADAIDRVQLNEGIVTEQVQHLLFAFCGSAPEAPLTRDLQSYDGTIRQMAVGLHVTRHQEFIAAIYGKVDVIDES